MRIAIAAVSILLFASAAAFGQETVIKWGQVEGGLQLGIGSNAQSPATPATLNVYLKNVGSETHKTIEYEGPKGRYYEVEFKAAQGDGQVKGLPVFDMPALAPIPGWLLPNTLRVAPGETHVFAFPMEHLSCVIDRKDFALENFCNRPSRSAPRSKLQE